MQERIGVRFRRQELLREAMTHASWNNERGRPSGPGYDNERLEYLGDAVLELVVGDHLFRTYPTYDEGRLTQLRASLVNTLSLARLAEQLELGEALMIGKGAAKTGINQLPRLLANSFEAMIGAVFVDQEERGYAEAARIFLEAVGDIANFTDDNHKGRLQALAQGRTGQPPQYRVEPTGGPGHRRSYRADAVVGGEIAGSGTGTTKQAAEQAAAQDAVERLSHVPARTRGRVSGALDPAAPMVAGADAVVIAGAQGRSRRRRAAAPSDGGSTDQATEIATRGVADAVAALARPPVRRRGAQAAAAEPRGAERVTTPPKGASVAADRRRGSPRPHVGAVPPPALEIPIALPPPRPRGIFGRLRGVAEALVRGAAQADRSADDTQSKAPREAGARRTASPRSEAQNVAASDPARPRSQRQAASSAPPSPRSPRRLAIEEPPASAGRARSGVRPPAAAALSRPPRPASPSSRRGPATESAPQPSTTRSAGGDEAGSSTDGTRRSRRGRRGGRGRRRDSAEPSPPHVALH